LNPTEKSECVQMVQRLTGKQSDVVSEDEIHEWARKVIVGCRNLIDIGTMTPIKWEAGPNGGASKSFTDALPVHVKTSILIFVVNLSGIAYLGRLGLES